MGGVKTHSGGMTKGTKKRFIKRKKKSKRIRKNTVKGVGGGVAEFTDIRERSST